MILVDSNYLISLMNDKEKNHDRAKLLAPKVDKEKKLITLLMMSEAIASIGTMKKGKITQQLYETLIENFEIYYPSPKDINQAMECVLKYDGTLSLADCLAVVIMKKLNITEIITFDDDFDKVNGIIRVY